MKGNLFGTPKKNEDQSDGLFDMGSAKKNNSSAKKKKWKFIKF